MITKIGVGAAIVLSAYVGGTAPAAGEPNPAGNNPDPFSTLSCSCQESTPAGDAREEIDRGIRDGLHASPRGPAWSS